LVAGMLGAGVVVWQAYLAPATAGQPGGAAADGEILKALPMLKAALAEAKAAEAQLVAGAVPAIEAKLTDGQKAGWAAIRAAPKDPGAYAMAPGITAGQLQELRMAKWKKARREMIAKAASDRSAAGASQAGSVAGRREAHRKARAARA